MRTIKLSSGQVSVLPEVNFTIHTEAGANVEIWIYNKAGQLICHNLGKSSSDRYIYKWKCIGKKGIASMAVVSVNGLDIVYKVQRE
ncbi:hypothetical protein [Parabacteroides sp. AM08-6]|uniref:hypothetical protein n=1 Tax=Parabacteroides sp. AM08-6 TaxID=2292053 RepID=UPI000EFE8ECF|nr:hypothetical protein [Parabacteroides sp. AM08-6]RHJ81485.1 hypothetical protein DW103_11555 [Parabacteroides sp. AM08-6]